jgi:Mu-like prophage host-nuclease inhibitor protein Gam
MARKKVLPDFRINDLQEADKALEELAALDRESSVIKNSLNEKIDAAKAEADSRMATVEARQKILEAALESYAALNKAALFQDRKSVELSFGSFGYRLSSKIVTAARSITWDMVLGKIRELKLDAVRIKEEVNKDTLATWSDEQLEKVGAKRKTVDSFGYSLKQEEPGQIKAA